MKKEKSSGKEFIDSIKQTIRHRKWDFDIVLLKKKKIHIDRIALKVPDFLLSKIKKPKLKKVLQKTTTIYLNNEIPGAVLDTLDILYKEKPCPKFKSKQLNLNGWTMSFKLVPGSSFADLEKKENYLADSTGCAVSLSQKGSFVCINIYTSKLKGKYPFEFDPLQYKNMILPFPVGYSHFGLAVEDLAALVHMLVAGITGGGKTNALFVILTALLTLPDPPLIAILDPKRVDFVYHADYGVRVISDPDQYDQFFTVLNMEMDRRLEVLSKSRTVQISRYNEKFPDDPMPRLVVVVDEVADLEDYKESAKLFFRLVRMSRAAGIHLIAATQRPTADIIKKFSNIRAQMGGRMCFYMDNSDSSEMILGNNRAHRLPAPPNGQGRGIFQHGSREYEFQAMYLDPEKDLERILSKSQKPKREWYHEQSAQRFLPR